MIQNPKEELQRRVALMDEARPMLEAKLASGSLMDFVRRTWHIIEPSQPFVTGWPIEAIAEHLTAVTNGEIHRLVITVPPGSTKSLMTRVFWPTWEWIRKPSNRYIGASYGQHLAERDNRRARAVIQSEWYQNRFDPRLAHDQKGKTNFANIDTGWMKATSIKGMGTGERGNRFIIDDPHNVLEAESEAVRNAALMWFREVVPSRLNDLDKDAIVVIMQRVHQEDVAQAAIDQGYDHLLIPMHYDSERAKPTSIGWTDPRTEEDELMWPARFSAKAIAELEKILGEYASSSQLEQSPIPRSGGLFKVGNIKMIDHLPDDLEIIYETRGWDLAGTAGGNGAYTAGVKIGYIPSSKEFIVLNAKRDRLGPYGVRVLMLETAESDGLETKIVFPQDPAQAGKAQAKDLTAMFAGYKAKKELQSGSKETRAEPFAAQVEGGNVLILNRPWAKDFLEELRYFPKSKYKDQVDASSSAFNEVASMIRIERPLLRMASGKQENLARVQ